MRFDYPKRLRFSCRRCATCCGDTKNRLRTVWLLQLEALNISQRTRMKIRDFAEETKRCGLYVFVMKKRENGKCVFLKNHNVCTIYDDRPLVCRFYPFELKESKCGIPVFAFTNECPSMGKGSRLGKAYFERLFENFAKLMRKNSLMSLEVVGNPGSL